MRRRIFIVEDHPTMQETYRMFIETEPDMEVCGIASTGAKALEQVPEVEPDLVIVDLALPDMNGLEVVRRLRARHPDLLIVVISGNKVSEFGQRVVQEGATGYIDKQEAPMTMIPALRRILGVD